MSDIAMKQRLLLTALQTVKGTPAALTGANAILCRMNEPELITANMVKRNLIKPYKGNSGSIATGVHRKFKIEAELAGSGAAGTAPAWAHLLQACGFAQTLSVGVSCVFDPISTGQKYLTMASYLGLIKMGSQDAYGTASLTLNAESIPTLAMDYVGEYIAPADVGSLPAGVDYSNFIDPVAVGKINTPTFEIHGVSGAMSDFTVTMADQLEYQDFAGDTGGATSPERTPTGTAAFKLTDVATYNWAESLRIGTKGALSLVHGTEAGNTIQIDAPAVRFTSLSITEKKGIAFLQAGFDLEPVLGNDEIRITAK